MRPIVWVRAWVVTIIACVGIAGCGGGGSGDEADDGGSQAPAPSGVTVASVAITTAATEIHAGANLQLSAEARSASGAAVSGATITWSSSSSALATVNSSGLVTGVGSGGSVTIRAESQGQAATLQLQVRPPLPPTAAIEVTPASGVVPVGGTLTITARARDAANNLINGAYFTFQSSSTSIASVSASSGIVSSVAVGTATVTVRSGDVTLNVPITVIPALEGTVKAGGGHACGITKLGSTYCWGSNGRRQLGAASTAEKSNKPLAVVGGMPFIDIAPGGMHTCALTGAGKAYCWGANENKQLGAGSATTELTVGAPFPVDTNQTFKSISAKSDQTCALTNDGDAYCWPKTSPSAQVNSSPTLVAGGFKFASISVGTSHACGLTSAGKAYCWGWNQDQQLGYQSVQQSIDMPVAVAGNLTFAEITAGSTHSCARTAAGQAYCWGSDQYGQLGDGATYQSGYTPRLVAGGLQFISISASGDFTSAVSSTGTAYFWGMYQWGCLDGAFGSTSCEYYERQSLTPASVGGTYTKVSAGGLFNIGLTESGQIGGWWLNNYGQLGDGSTTNFRTSPLIANADFQIQAQPSLTVQPGQSVTMPITVTRTGSFTTSGVGLPESIDLTLQSATGYSGTFQPSRLAPEQSQSVLTLNPASTLQPGTTTLTVRAQATGGLVRTAAVSATVPGAGGSGGTQDLVCTTENTALPSGYHCMKNSAGQLVPGRYSYTSMHGWWVDEEAELCINWGSNGQASGRYRAPQLGGGSTTQTPTGKWGVIVKRSGEPEGTSTIWYVFTAPLDAQTVLLSYDSSSNTIVNWHFQKRSACPW